MTADIKRQHWTKAEGEDLVAKWKATGLTQAAYCRTHGLSDRKLSYWIKATRPSSPLATTTGFVELRPEPARGELKLQLPGGMYIPLERGFDAAVLRAVVEALT